jgi:hypothetical protein
MGFPFPSRAAACPFQLDPGLKARVQRFIDPLGCGKSVWEERAGERLSVYGVYFPVLP